ncbi:MAG: hypothetical protein JSV50_13565 [Desulfobacteraceae bacterium]|nr:MAG: hypothetical protein JSV50_13565 [Desulfobacteraceae bacterium]
MEQKSLECAKWRWEFLRRKKQFGKDLKKVRELRKEPNFDRVKEKEFCKKWGLNSFRMPDPDNSFEEIIETKADGQELQSWAENYLKKWLFLGEVNPALRLFRMWASTLFAISFPQDVSKIISSSPSSRN